MDKLNFDYQDPSKLYMEELRAKGHFTEQDLLELEDHYLLTYNYYLDQGLAPTLALEETKDKLNITRAVIQSYAQKNKSKTGLELLYFSMFGFGAIVYILMPLGYFLMSLPMLLGYIFPEQHPFYSIQYKAILFLLFLLQILGHFNS